MPSKTARRGAGTGALFKDARGLWTAVVELPPDPATGKRRRKVVRSKSRGTAQAKLRALRADLDRAGDLPTASPTVEAWLTWWLVNVSAKRVRPSTQVNRASDVRLHIAPVIGRVKLEKLTPAHVIQMHDAITGKGNSPTTALRCHRLLHVALRDAIRAGKVARNVASPAHVDAPSPAVATIRTLTPDEAFRVLQAAADDPHGARWATSLLTGARRGEVLGLEVDRIDPVRGALTLSWQLQRLQWEHGCQDAGGRVTCPAKRGGSCPARRFRAPADFEMRQVHGGLHLVRPKTKAGWRVVPLVDPLASILTRHVQSLPADYEGLVFTEANGQPIDPRDDGARWAALLERAGVEHVRMHDVRHTAATLLLSAGVDPRVIRDILGHSTVAMTQHYQHVDLTMAADALTRLGAQITPRITAEG